MNREQHIDPMITKRMEFETLCDYLVAEQQTSHTGYRIEREGDVVYVYCSPRAMGTRCYCGLWQGLPDYENASLTWCQCARGFLERCWEGILGRPAQVEVLASSIAGADECRFAVHF
jgi:hypothetical protein